MQIQHEKKFIELIARNNLENKKDTWLWFSHRRNLRVLGLAANYISVGLWTNIDMRLQQYYNSAISILIHSRN